jgi:hypothetical protein
VGKSRLKEFQTLTEKVRKRVKNWKVKFLSQAGKEILLKVVVQAIPTYNMSIFLCLKLFAKILIPLCKDFGGVIRKM